MADTKITALAAITTVDPAADVLPIVDISDTSMAASGTTKKITSNQILGSGGTATLASATITGALVVDTTTLVVDPTNNRVGINTATPGFPLDVKSATAVFKLESTTGTNAAYLYATSTGGDFYFGRDNSTGATFGTGTGYSAVVYSANAYPMVFFTNATERARITASGDVNISTGNVVMGTSGKGIDFSAVTGGTGTATANVLNDYEEGTFTPTIGGTATYTAQTGTYTKVGRLVTASFDITILLRGTGDSFAVSGLPFAASANVGAAVAVSYFSGLATSSASIYGYVNTSAMAFNTIAAGGGTSPSGAVVITDGTRLAGTAVYMV
jgi:hypothetical protein